jgi:hypothetical protein
MLASTLHRTRTIYAHTNQPVRHAEAAKAQDLPTSTAGYAFFRNPPSCQGASQGNRMNAICNGSDRGGEEKLLAREGQKRFAAMELAARAGLKAANLSFWRRFARTVTRQTTRRNDKCIHAIALPVSPFFG